ncbi:hypothetical protein CCR98_07590 [Stenotrophomonas sp. WZN-1]|uniref:hypothetical protein n=1 Tax=Stenotrophomonas sp. WZN-1 TaxID=2005046 RepID=UPI000B42D9D8|nr:hypothetical protein [Stenotrophomonas sp. WZN-1]ARZ74037.1 hypothetical protein CCR98_07590 [Stenotrophomonas sp. WZN-1]
MTNSKPAYGDLEQRIEALEEELSFQRRSEGRSFYEKFIDAAAGNGIEMLTEVGYEMAARIGDLECQRDELVAENAQQLTMLLDLGRRLNIATGAIKSTVALEVDGCADDAERDHCWCHTCRDKRPLNLNEIRMVLCPTCRNKRCPKANDHRNECSGSNEPGQKWSAYP